MAHYTMECSECNATYGVVIPISKFDERMKEERSKSCPSCNKTNTLVNLVGNALVVYRGDGWTGKTGSTSQEKLDAALAENDRLQDASKTDRLYRKKEDEFKRKEEKAREMALKANGVAI